MNPDPSAPIWAMLAWYERHPGPLPFFECVEMYERHGGVVVSTREYFVMGRPVPWTAPEHLINETVYPFAREECDAWYIFAMAGDLRKVWEALPYDLPLICFNRHGQKNLRFYPLRRMSDICGKLIPQQTRRSAVRSPAPEGDEGHVQA